MQNLVLIFDPVDVSQAQYTFLIKLRKYCLDSEIDLNNKSEMSSAYVTVDDGMAKWAIESYEQIVKCLRQGFDCDGDKVSTCIEKPSDIEPKQFIVDLLSSRYMEIEDLVKKFTESSLCKKKSLRSARKVLSNILKTMIFKGYPLVCLLDQKIGLKYNLGTKVDLTIKVEDENGIMRPKTQKDVVIEFLKDGKHSKEEIAVELYRKNTKEEKVRVDRILTDIRKMGILHSEIIGGRGFYHVEERPN
jgi:hypothetical protein